jgi:hypothetical protein
MKLVILAFAASAAAQCALPSVYNWTSTDILAEPLSGWSTLRELTTVPYKGKNLVYVTMQNTALEWGTVGFDLFSDWSEMATAKQTLLSQHNISPNLFYFAPKDVWILAHQWGPTTFSYKTSKDPSKVDSWSPRKELFSGRITNSDTGPLDPALIGDDKNMYLFFAADNGRLYRADMPLADFPGTFGAESEIVLEDSQRRLIFEGPQVYKIKGQQKYLLIVGALGTRGRFIRSFTADSLTGKWTPNAADENNPFAGLPNMNAAWTNDVFQGELLRDSADQTMTVDLCNLQMLYQGRLKRPGDVFSLIPYRPALLTLDRS